MEGLIFTDIAYRVFTNVFPLDISEIIMDCLWLDDLLKFAQTVAIDDARLNKKVQVHCVALIEKRLQEWGIPGLSNAVRESKMMISGSFVLQTCLGETWEDSDIDIYACGMKTGLFHGTSVGEFVWNNRDKTHGDRDHNGGECDCAWSFKQQYNEDGLGIQQVDEYILEKGNRHVQIIQVNNTNIWEWVCGGFDFDFCCIAYDGNRIQIKHPASIALRSSKRINALVPPGDINDSHKYYAESKTYAIGNYRCVKYISRGFSIPGYVEPDSLDVLSLTEKQKDFLKRHIKIELFEKATY